jgi:hypothetical protein
VSASPALALKPHCQARTKAGKSCGMPPVRGERFCFTHHPDYAEESRKAREIGAHTYLRKVQPDAEPLAMGSATEVLESLSRISTGVLRGEVDVKIANCLGVLMNTALRAIDHRLEDRVGELEAAVADRLERST